MPVSAGGDSAGSCCAGKEYGEPGHRATGRLKVPIFLGVKAVIAESFERIHRSNLVGMGVLPLQYQDGESAETLGLDGTEHFSIAVTDDTKPKQLIDVVARKADGTEKKFSVKSRMTPRWRLIIIGMAVFFRPSSEVF